MSNCEAIELPLLDRVEPYQVTEVLRCLVHTILFQRALGTVVPRDIDAEIFDITWTTCGDPELERRIESKIAAVQSWVDHHPGQRVQVCLSFYEQRQQSGWLLRQQQRCVWESWTIPIHLVATEDQHSFEAEADRSRRKAELQTSLEDTIGRIVSVVNEKRDHIPPVVSGAALTFPFDITVTSTASIDGSGSVFGVDFVKRMLSSAQPPSVLH